MLGGWSLNTGGKGVGSVWCRGKYFEPLARISATGSPAARLLVIFELSTIINVLQKPVFTPFLKFNSDDLCCEKAVQDVSGRGFASVCSILGQLLLRSNWKTQKRREEGVGMRQTMNQGNAAMELLHALWLAQITVQSVDLDPGPLCKGLAA